MAYNFLVEYDNIQEPGMPEVPSFLKPSIKSMAIFNISGNELLLIAQFIPLLQSPSPLTWK